ncbi:MAG: hypothetical protein ACOC32_01885 [Nanoarchaeota archaeon]
MTLWQYLALDPEGKRCVREFRELYDLIKAQEHHTLYGHKPIPSSYKPVLRGRSFVPASSVLSLEERIRAIEPELRRVFAFTLKHQGYRSRKLDNVLEHYFQKYRDYLNSFLTDE